jgi:hypothetical protein
LDIGNLQRTEARPLTCSIASESKHAREHWIMQKAAQITDGLAIDEN